MMTSAPSTASTFEATVRTPYSRSRVSRRSGRGWLATTWLGSTRAPRSMPAIIASAMTPEPTVAIVDFARGDIARSIAARSCRSGGLGRAAASARLVAGGRHARQEEAAGGRHAGVPKAGIAECRLELARLVVDLDDREFAAVGKTAERGVIGRCGVVGGTRLGVRQRIDECERPAGIEPAPDDPEELGQPGARHVAQPEACEDGVHLPVGVLPGVADVEMSPQLVRHQALARPLERSGRPVVERLLA